jgi:hypothetical protein
MNNRVNAVKSGASWAPRSATSAQRVQIIGPDLVAFRQESRAVVRPAVRVAYCMCKLVFAEVRKEKQGQFSYRNIRPRIA